MSTFTDDEIKKAQAEVEKIIDSGAPIVKMNIFDVLDSYTPSLRIKNIIDYTLELYLELVSKLKEYSEEEQVTFLNALKEADIIDNQSIEKEDSFLISLHRKFEHKVSIDYLLEKMTSGEPISKEEFIKIHDVLLVGTSSEDKLGLRDNDLKFVGSYQVTPQTKFFFENRAISYFPLKHTEIDAALDKFLNFYNSGIKPNHKYDMFLLPMVCHGLIASLQLFKDGNTRYGRLFQNVLLYEMVNKEANLDLKLPIVYASRQYAAYRDDYRKKVENIVLNNNHEAWESWFSFNLNRIQDGILYNLRCLETIKDLNGNRSF